MQAPKGPDLSPPQQVAARIGRDHYIVDIRAGQHFMTADEPLDLGGKDLGGTPYGYLLSALGACTAITLRMYADRKKIDLESVTVYLRHDKIHASDCENCEETGQGKTAKIDVIERTIELSGALSDPERQRLLEIADRCPIHRTLESAVRIISKKKSNREKT